MRENRSFWKAVHSLSHPLSVLAILLLLFNDHYLRWHYPSWLTGKLGDFSWLVFAPFVAAMLFSFLSPQEPRLIGILSIAFIGLWFASFKTIPLVMDVTKNLLEALVGWRGSLGMDASDLLTLPALGISWHIWKNAREDMQYLRPVIYVAFGLGIMGTLATSYPPPPPAYINVICEMSDGSLQTNSGSSISMDGGMTWQAASSSPIAMRCSDESRRSTRNFENGRMYRWIRGERVEYSTDGGENWLLLRDLHELRQDARLLLNHNTLPDLSPSNLYLLSPVSGLVHSETGNLVLAMSADGVLIITENGESYWVSVGGYELADLNDWANNQEILKFYFFLIPTLAFLVLVTTVVIIQKGDGLIIWLFFGWSSWGILLAWVLTAGQSTGGIAMWGLLALASLFFIAVPLSLWALYHLFKYYRSAILPILVSGAITCLANFFPMFLWAQGTIPRYHVAVLFSLGLTAAVLATCYAYFRPKLPSRFIPEKEKRKNDEA